MSVEGRGRGQGVEKSPVSIRVCLSIRTLKVCDDNVTATHLSGMAHSSLPVSAFPVFELMFCSLETLKKKPLNLSLQLDLGTSVEAKLTLVIRCKYKFEHEQNQC